MKSNFKISDNNLEDLLNTFLCLLKESVETVGGINVLADGGYPFWLPFYVYLKKLISSGSLFGEFKFRINGVSVKWIEYLEDIKPDMAEDDNLRKLLYS